jgi:hypothetical protein
METTAEKLAKLMQEVNKMELKDQRIILDIMNIILEREINITLERDQLKKQVKEKKNDYFRATVQTIQGKITV